MIVTLTPNPSLDRTLVLDRLVRGEVNRALESRLEPGGKGVNVTRALVANGSTSIAVFPCGGNNGRLMELLIAEERVTARVVPVGGPIRVNTAIVEPDGTTTKVNEPGSRFSEAETAAVLDQTASLLPHATWLAVCGSLAPGMPAHFPAHAVRLARDAGVRCAVDASGAALESGVSAGPDLIKPNRTELAELVGRPLDRLADVRAAAAELVRGGVGAVVVSLGRDGALAVDADTVALATATTSRPKSTVGAGDSLLAGMLFTLERSGTLADALATGVTWGTAAVQLPGTQVPRPGDLAGITPRTTYAPDEDLALAD
ncbi:1-phosphofructokinase [Allobranchiibius huperziae]|uniref:1-phosphofructokinase n=1 Tax=Allobranchiibius huperziae TaxID=1874116 RepID=A0A853DK63_9MICO|nr:1-phosphofructokinase [Allobranchiibius huperziae]NYJ75374.1 1-phosphofructokinase/6-phosphofructokinase 2 [Allobranchiibius huperziae]